MKIDLIVLLVVVQVFLWHGCLGQCESGITLGVGDACSSKTFGCCESGLTCYRKNEFYAGCFATCTPGQTDGHDDLPWACELVTADDAGGDDVGGITCDDNGLGDIANNGFAKKHGKLKLDGVQLVDASNQPIQLIGMSSHGLHFFPNCYSKESIQFLVETWGINLFRAAMYVGEGGFATNQDLNKNMVKDIVDICEELGIYVMIDWHVLNPGDPNAFLDSKGASTGLAIDFWKEMATLYKDKDHVIYEIANEPNGVDWLTVKAYHDAVIAEIRKIDASTIIIAGTPTFSQDIHLAAQDPVEQPLNVMYAFHFYAGTHDFLFSRVTQHKQLIPIFVTEWGTSEASGDGGPFLETSKKFLDMFADPSGGQIISSAAWNFADKNEVSSALLPGACQEKDFTKLSCTGRFLRNFIRQSNGNFTGGGDNNNNNDDDDTTNTSSSLSVGFFLLLLTLVM